MINGKKGFLIRCILINPLKVYHTTDFFMCVSAYPGHIDVSILNASSSSRFDAGTKIKQNVHELFLEEIFNETSFSAYYEECAPISCTYVLSARFDWIFVITTLVALVGGLNVALRLITPHFD